MIRNLLKYQYRLSIVCLCLLARLIPGTRTIDDAFITFRYVRNILNGLGLVYNPGEAVLGTTTPFYTILLSILGKIALAGNTDLLPVISLIVNTIADCATCLLLIAIGSYLGSIRVGFITAVLWAVAPFSVTFAIGGLETSVYVFWLVLTGYCYITKRYPLGGFAASMSLLTRPDALIFLGPIAAFRFFQLILKKERINWSEIVLFSVPTIGWFIYAMCQFGNVLPHSIQAKLIIYHLNPYDSLIRLLQHYATPFLDENIGGKYAIMAGIILYPFFDSIGILRGFRKNPLLGIILGYPLVYLITFAVVNPLIFRWYLTPPLPFYFLGILLGAEKLVSDLVGLIKSYSLQRWLIAILLLGYPFSSMMTEWTLIPDHGNHTPAPKMAYIKLELLYAQTAQKIIEDESFSPNCVIAAGDVGVLGFITGAKILDTVGLNTPKSLRYYPIPAEKYVINYAIPSELIVSEQPDYLAFLDVYGKKTILDNSKINNDYEIIFSIPTSIYGSQNLILMKNKNNPCGE